MKITNGKILTLAIALLSVSAQTKICNPHTTIYASENPGINADNKQQDLTPEQLQYNIQVKNEFSKQLTKRFNDFDLKYAPIITFLSTQNLLADYFYNYLFNPKQEQTIAEAMGAWLEKINKDAPSLLYSLCLAYRLGIIPYTLKDISENKKDEDNKETNKFNDIITQYQKYIGQGMNTGELTIEKNGETSKSATIIIDELQQAIQNNEKYKSTPSTLRQAINHIIHPSAQQNANATNSPLKEITDKLNGLSDSQYATQYEDIIDCYNLTKTMEQIIDIQTYIKETYNDSETAQFTDDRIKDLQGILKQLQTHLDKALQNDHELKGKLYDLKGKFEFQQTIDKIKQLTTTFHKFHFTLNYANNKFAPDNMTHAPDLKEEAKHNLTPQQIRKEISKANTTLGYLQGWTQYKDQNNKVTKGSTIHLLYAISQILLNKMQAIEKKLGLDKGTEIYFPAANALLEQLQQASDNQPITQTEIEQINKAAIYLPIRSRAIALELGNNKRRDTKIGANGDNTAETVAKYNKDQASDSEKDQASDSEDDD